ncbi:AMP-binding protein [uncultured Sphingomonas sp.]|uniref:AMP-binding protein n=1 Tax=uncultured Sphingomonas sp. TaxID=158754 RepID=UPI0035CC5243
MITRKTLHGWSIRWDEARAKAAHAGGWWVDETLADVAARIAAETPDRLLVVDNARRLDAATLHGEASALAQAMAARGLKPGAVVSFMLPNWHEAAVIYLAATLAGLVAHPIVPALRDSEVGFMLADIGSRMMFVPAEFRGHDYPAMLDRVNATLVDPPEIVVLRGPVGRHTAYDTLLAAPAEPVALPPVDADAVKMVLYTSGTTGRPKGVMHSHNSIHALVTQIRRNWLVEPGDGFFVPSPVSHIGGSIYAFEFPLLFGTVAILQDQWDADAAVAIMTRERCTHMAGATPFLEQLLASARRADTRLPDLKVFICGGASVPPSLIRAASGYFERAAVTRVFGSTEVPVTTIGALAAGDLDHAAETDGRIGIAEVKLVDPAGAIADMGEVCARGPQMMVGYLWTEDERDAFDADGYFCMGDIARRIDGDYLVVTGRAKDIIIRQGENIAPKEIEDMLVEHPDIAEIAIVGLPDRRTGERACAVIVPSGELLPDVTALRAFLDARKVARFKIPEQVAIWDALPRNVAGKVLKHRIRDTLIAQDAAGS